jgi:hypothetical protein
MYGLQPVTAAVDCDGETRYWIIAHDIKSATGKEFAGTPSFYALDNPPGTLDKLIQSGKFHLYGEQEEANEADMMATRGEKPPPGISATSNATGTDECSWARVQPAPVSIMGVSPAFLKIDKTKTNCGIGSDNYTLAKYQGPDFDLCVGAISCKPFTAVKYVGCRASGYGTCPAAKQCAEYFEKNFDQTKFDRDKAKKGWQSKGYDVEPIVLTTPKGQGLCFGSFSDPSGELSGAGLTKDGQCPSKDTLAKDECVGPLKGKIVPYDKDQIGAFGNAVGGVR